MTPLDEGRCEVVREWLAGAEEDYRLAQHVLHTAAQFAQGIAFHSQQAAEKYIKAFLTCHQVEFPKIHGIRELLQLVATVDPALAERLREATALTPFAVRTRYPHPARATSLLGARSAVRLAGEVREVILAALQPYLDGA